MELFVFTEHMLDNGGLRRATLHGCEKPTKRQLAVVLNHNVSQLPRHHVGIVTIEQAAAPACKAPLRVAKWMWRGISMRADAFGFISGDPDTKPFPDTLFPSRPIRFGTDFNRRLRVCCPGHPGAHPPSVMRTSYTLKRYCCVRGVSRPQGL